MPVSAQHRTDILGEWKLTWRPRKLRLGKQNFEDRIPILGRCFPILLLFQLDGLLVRYLLCEHRCRNFTRRPPPDMGIKLASVVKHLVTTAAVIFWWSMNSIEMLSGWPPTCEQPHFKLKRKAVGTSYLSRGMLVI